MNQISYQLSSLISAKGDVVKLLFAGAEMTRGVTA
jgi:hypothetical protein